MDIFRLSIVRAPDIKRPTATSIARQYNVSEKTIRDIWKGRTWHEETLPLDLKRPIKAKVKTGRPLGRKDSIPRKSRTICSKSNSANGVGTAGSQVPSMLSKLQQHADCQTNAESTHRHSASTQTAELSRPHQERPQMFDGMTTDKSHMFHSFKIDASSQEIRSNLKYSHSYNPGRSQNAFIPTAGVGGMQDEYLSPIWHAGIQQIQSSRAASIPSPQHPTLMHRPQPHLSSPAAQRAFSPLAQQPLLPQSPLLALSRTHTPPWSPPPLLQQLLAAQQQQQLLLASSIAMACLPQPSPAAPAARLRPTPPAFDPSLPVSAAGPLFNQCFPCEGKTPPHCTQASHSAAASAAGPASESTAPHRAWQAAASSGPFRAPWAPLPAAAARPLPPPDLVRGRDGPGPGPGPGPGVASADWSLLLGRPQPPHAPRQ